MDEIILENIDYSKRKAKKTMIICIITHLIFLSLSVIFITLFAIEKNKNNENNNNDSEKDNKSTPKTEFLTLWNDRTPKNELINYITKITNEKSDSFVPKEDRIAVFDLDGTLFQETDPIYLDHKLYMYRVLNDSNYTPTNEQKELAYKIKEYADKGEFPPLNKEHAILNAEIFADMEIEELYKYTKNYLDQPSDGYNNMKRGDAFYKPMLEVIDYLQKNDFIIYVVSGTDRFTVRAIIEGHINIPKSQVIGTEAKIIADNQGEIDGLDYIFQKGDKLQFKGELVSKNLNMNKVYNIIKEIGKIPILSFGNSGSDSSMAELVLKNKNGKAFMVLCDDLERERGDINKAKSMENNCIKNNWISISMHDDWKTIYGYDVTKK